MFSGKNILNRAMPERLRTLRHCIFHRRGRREKRHLQRRFLRKRGAYGGRPCSPRGAVAQRLRGFKSAEPKKTVKRSSRRTGVNLQFFSVQPTSSGLKGASSPFFVAPARRNRWHFSGSLLVSKENIPGQQCFSFPPLSAIRAVLTPIRAEFLLFLPSLWYIYGNDIPV